MPRHICWVFISLLLLSGCEPRAAHPGAERPKEFAVSASEDTSLRREIAPDTAEHKGRSGFRLIATGKDAFLTRIAMVRMAERGVDMQYYSVNNDRTAQALLRELVLVADRGVRVRVLIDGLNIGKIDEIASMMHAHPHMEIRVFNPLTTVHKPFWTHVTHYVTEFDRFSKRMHNKTLIVDNQVAVLGGRNISDHYFDASGDFNFNDMDVITAGPITSQISRSFDAYWNSAETYTYDEITKSVPDKEEIQEVRHELDEKWESVMQTSFGPILKDLKPLDYLGKGKPLTWAPMELAVDRPDKINQEQEEADSAPFQRLETLLAHAEHEFIGVAPYLVPTEIGMERLKALVDRKISVRLLTNSLASTDVVAVHSAYASYRRGLLENGIELYEFKPIPGKRSRQSFLGSSSRSSLHAKVYVIDRRDVLIGSFNLDPRSVQLNTELVLLIHDKATANRLVKMFEESTQPANSYHLALTDPAHPASSAMLWLTDKDGQRTTYRSDPNPGFWRTFFSHAIGLLPVESQM